MRTTLDIDDDLITALKPVAAAQQRSLGRLISDIIRTSMRPRQMAGERDGFPLFELQQGAPMFRSDDVARALDE